MVTNTASSGSGGIVYRLAPEPGTLALVIGGIAALAGRRRRVRPSTP
jgi:hypothetical protein